MEPLNVNENNMCITWKLGVILEILQYFTLKEQIKLQLLNKRMYEEVVPLFIQDFKLNYGKDDKDIWFSYTNMIFQHD